MIINNAKRVGKLAIVVTVFGGIVYYALPDNTASYEAPVVEEAPEAPAHPADWTAEAEAAYQAVIRKKELEVTEAQLVAEISAKQAKLDEVRKELGTY